MRIRLIQQTRKFIKATVWTPLTWTLDRLGMGLHSVQVLCIDRSADNSGGRVLILSTKELGGQYCPVQGLRASQRLTAPRGKLDQDARGDARRELLEEATPTPPPIERFRLVHRYREGTWRGRYTGQFACSVFVVDCIMAEIPLRGETGEGTPCWARIDDAVVWLDSPVLTPILRGDPVPPGNFEPRRAGARRR